MLYPKHSSHSRKPFIIQSKPTLREMPRTFHGSLHPIHLRSLSSIEFLFLCCEQAFEVNVTRRIDNIPGFSFVLSGRVLPATSSRSCSVLISLARRFSTSLDYASRSCTTWVANKHLTGGSSGTVNEEVGEAVSPSCVRLLMIFIRSTYSACLALDSWSFALTSPHSETWTMM